MKPEQVKDYVFPVPNGALAVANFFAKIKN
jgi:hypothetical protein